MHFFRSLHWIKEKMENGCHSTNSICFNNFEETVANNEWTDQLTQSKCYALKMVAERVGEEQIRNLKHSFVCAFVLTVLLTEQERYLRYMQETRTSNVSGLKVCRSRSRLCLWAIVFVSHLVIVFFGLSAKGNTASVAYTASLLMHSQ